MYDSVSNSLEPQSYNQFYRELNKYFDDAFLVPSDSNDPYLERVYTAQRSPIDLSQLERFIVDRLKGYDCNALNEYLRDGQIGQQELDLLDVLLNRIRTYHISIVGDVGVGKSSFLHFTLNHLLTKIDKSRSHLALFVDCLSLVDPEVAKDRERVINEMQRTLRLYLKRISASKNTAPALSEALDDFSDRWLRDARLHRPDAPRLRWFFTEAIDILRSHGVSPIIVFDNIDHVHQENVPIILSLTRSIWRENGVNVILAMRPNRSYIGVPNFDDRQIFLRYRLFLKGPDLKSLIHRRLSLAYGTASKEKKRIFIGNTTFLISHDASKKLLERSSDLVLERISQEELFTGLANKNIRRFLHLFSKFFISEDFNYKYVIRDFMNEAFADGASQEDQEFEFDSNVHRSQVIRGMMRGHYSFFRDRLTSSDLITNILYFSGKRRPVNYLLPHLILSYFSIKGRDNRESWEKVLNDFQEIGYSYTVIRAIIEKFITRGLLSGPNRASEYYSNRDMIFLSGSGSFYFVHLLRESTYLLEACCDTPIWQNPHSGRRVLKFHEKFELLTLYLKAVLEEEKSLERVPDPEACDALRGVKAHGPLSARVYRAVRQMHRRALSPAGNQIVRSSMEAMRDEINQLGQEVAASRVRFENLTDLVSSDTELGPGPKVKLMRSDDENASVSFPIDFSASDEPEISISVPRDEKDRFWSLAAFIDGTLSNNVKVRQLACLGLEEDTDTYSGKSKIDTASGTDLKWDDLYVTVYKGTSPFLTRKLA